MTIRAATVLSCVLFICVSVHAQTAPQIIMEKDKAVAVSFVADGITDSWNVFMEKSQQPLAGKKEERKDTLLFRPLIPFQPGITYQIRNKAGTSHEFKIPEREVTKPKVVHIYPSSDSLPSNFLKFYIEFSEPMAEGDPYPYLHLVNAEDDTLDKAFLKQLPALWNQDQTMLSLWLDPGRIKRDLELNKRLGMPMDHHGKYRLVVESGLNSRNGASLQTKVYKSFETTAADRAKPKADNWDLDIPKQNTSEPLVIKFNEPMDYLSTKDRLVISRDKKLIEGKSVFSSNERKWRFVPTNPWREGKHIIKANARMEDLAGNNLNRLFDRNIEKDTRLEKEYHTISFVIK